MAKHPVSGLEYYFIDMCLPFGASISCALFQEFSDAVAFIVQSKLGTTIFMPIVITNYLDDFLFIALCMFACNGAMGVFLQICQKVGCPISSEKTEYASPIMIFLGVLLNGSLHLIAIPEEKRIKAIHLLRWAVCNMKVMIKFIQKLTGVLNFLNRAIVPGRAFT